MHKDKFNEEFSFPIYEDIADLPFGEHPSVLKEGVAGICLEGSATVEIFERRCPVVKNNLLVLFPYVQTSLKDVSGDFRIRFFKVSADFFNDIMSGLVNMTLEFYFYMLCHCTYPLNENEVERFLHFLELIRIRAGYPLEYLRKDAVLQMLRPMYYDLYAAYQVSLGSGQKRKYSTKERIAFQFAHLVIENYTVSRELSFYADKMNLSSKYLSQVVLSVTGRSAQEWISRYTIHAIKTYLQNFSLDIKEIVALVNFPSQSNMSRYFKHYTDMSPTQYRNSLCGQYDPEQ